MNTTPLHGAYAPSGLKNLLPLLEDWRKLMRRLAYEWKANKDCPWWYLERTAVGFFSASVWNQGGRAIEEYGTDKKSRTHKKKRCNGRGDLMFSVKKRSREQWFVAEAKQSHPPIRGKIKALKARIRNKLKLARQDVVRCKSLGCSRLGLLFLCPYASVRAPEHAEIRKWISDLQKVYPKNTAAVAWTFPTVTRSLSYGNGKKKEFYPGVALLVRRPRRTMR